MPSSNRKRVIGVRRYPGGRIVHGDRRPAETPEEKRATVIAYRSRHYPGLDPESQYTGYELGRLFLRSEIDERQRDAGESWARLVVRFARTMGYPTPTPRSVELEEGRGLLCLPEPDPDHILKLRRAYADAFAAIAGAGRHVQVACKAVCIEDADTRGWPPHTMAALRSGLTRLADYFQPTEKRL